MCIQDRLFDRSPEIFCILKRVYVTSCTIDRKLRRSRLFGEQKWGLKQYGTCLVNCATANDVMILKKGGSWCSYSITTKRREDCLKEVESGVSGVAALLKIRKIYQN